MDQLFPEAVEAVDLAILYGADQRQSDIKDRPWVLANMISSLDGAIAIDGVSGGLGGPADKAVFVAIRSVPDVILVGSGTVVAENYRRPQTSPETQELRVSRGQSALPRIAIVSGSLSIEADHQVFDSDARPMVITHGQSPLDRRKALSEVADVLVAGDSHVDLSHALRSLKEDGANTVLLEGGPTLNGAMAAADLIDEMSISVAPWLVGGNASRMLAGSHTPDPRSMRLDRVLHQDGYLFLRYVRRS